MAENVEYVSALRLGAAVLTIVASVVWSLATMDDDDTREQRRVSSVEAARLGLEQLAQSQARGLLQAQSPPRGGIDASSEATTAAAAGAGTGGAGGGAAHATASAGATWSTGISSASSVTTTSESSSTPLPMGSHAPLVAAHDGSPRRAVQNSPNQSTHRTNDIHKNIYSSTDVLSPSGMSDASDLSFNSMTTVANGSPPPTLSLGRSAVFGGLQSPSGPASCPVRDAAVGAPETLLNYQIEVEPYGVGVVRKVVRKFGRTTRFEVIFPAGVGLKVLKLRRGNKGNVDYKLLQRL